MPSSAHSSTASGTRARNESADSSSSTPPSGDVRSLPPARSPASSSTTRAPRRRPSQAAASPVMPPPTTARSTCTVMLRSSGGRAVATKSGPGRDVGRPANRGGGGRSGGPHQVGQRRHDGGVVVDRGGAGERQARLAGHPAGVDVEVVEDLEVVRDETL